MREMTGGENAARPQALTPSASAAHSLPGTAECPQGEESVTWLKTTDYGGSLPDDTRKSLFQYPVCLVY